jgi:solute carrier family 25 (peroxisomal adenine nucleotide transporter), member 17
MPEETIVSEVLAASLGGAVSAGILYPLEVLKTKLQALTDDDEDDAEENKEATQNTTATAPRTSRAMIPFAMQLYREEGLSVFFRGVETSAFQSALEKALYFFSYTALKGLHRNLTGHADLPGVTNLAVGYLADWAHLPITLPVDAWTTRIQTSSQKDAPLKILLNMLSDRNCNFYKGLSAYYLLCFKPALQYTVYEQVKQIVLRRPHRQNKNLSAGEAFVLGMIARTVATILVFPFLRAKVLMQTSNNNNNATTGSSLPDEGGTSSVRVLADQYHKFGILKGWYQGIAPELTRGIFASALMLMIKERLAILVREFLGKRPPPIRRW